MLFFHVFFSCFFSCFLLFFHVFFWVFLKKNTCTSPSVALRPGGHRQQLRLEGCSSGRGGKREGERARRMIFVLFCLFFLFCFSFFVFFVFFVCFFFFLIMLFLFFKDLVLESFFLVESFCEVQNKRRALWRGRNALAMLRKHSLFDYSHFSFVFFLKKIFDWFETKTTRMMMMRRRRMIKIIKFVFFQQKHQ